MGQRWSESTVLEHAVQQPARRAPAASVRKRALVREGESKSALARACRARTHLFLLPAQPLRLPQLGRLDPCRLLALLLGRFGCSLLSTLEGLCEAVLLLALARGWRDAPLAARVQRVVLHRVHVRAPRKLKQLNPRERLCRRRRRSKSRGLGLGAGGRNVVAARAVDGRGGLVDRRGRSVGTRWRGLGAEARLRHLCEQRGVVERVDGGEASIVLADEVDVEDVHGGLPRVLLLGVAAPHDEVLGPALGRLARPLADDAGHLEEVLIVVVLLLLLRLLLLGRGLGISSRRRWAGGSSGSGRRPGSALHLHGRGRRGRAARGWSWHGLLLLNGRGDLLGRWRNPRLARAHVEHVVALDQIKIILEDLVGRLREDAARLATRGEQLGIGNLEQLCK